MFSTHFEDVPPIVAGWRAVVRTVGQEKEATPFTFLQKLFTAKVLVRTLRKVVSGSSAKHLKSAADRALLR